MENVLVQLLRGEPWQVFHEASGKAYIVWVKEKFCLWWSFFFDFSAHLTEICQWREPLTAETSVMRSGMLLSASL